MERKNYRDSQGRTREEEYSRLRLANDSPESLMSIRIKDPVAGVRFLLNVPCHTAAMAPYNPTPPRTQVHKNLPTQAPPANAPDDESRERLFPKAVWEDLGTDTMEGLVVHGTRDTITIPISFEGNDRPITVVRERWFSKELNIDILEKESDPRSGETTTRLTDLDLSDPDPALFQVPEDYTIVEQQPTPSVGFLGFEAGVMNFGSCRGTVNQIPSHP